MTLVRVVFNKAYAFTFKCALDVAWEDTFPEMYPGTSMYDLCCTTTSAVASIPTVQGAACTTCSDANTCSAFTCSRNKVNVFSLIFYKFLTSGFLLNVILMFFFFLSPTCFLVWYRWWRSQRMWSRLSSSGRCYMQYVLQYQYMHHTHMWYKQGTTFFDLV